MNDIPFFHRYFFHADADATDEQMSRFTDADGLVYISSSSSFSFTGPVVELEPVTASQSSTLRAGFGAGNCIDGDTETVHPGKNAMCHTKKDLTPWISIDYGTRVIVERVEIFNRRDCCGDRTRNVDVRISDQLPTSGDQMFSGGSLLGHFAGPGTKGQHIIISGQKLLLNHYC